MTEIAGESCFQALLQVFYTNVNGLPKDTWSSVIRVGGISISFISIIYGFYGFMTHQLSIELKRNATLQDFMRCYSCNYCCNHCCNYCCGSYHPDVEADDTPEDVPDCDQEEAESML